ncbi:hypothetical protein CDG81_21515 [Actinopolyspora erythraea]|uniref:Transcriptional regulator n=1 Tax=Actinopolyspora erythraea TaxID=414996 RepID=A0A099DA00_9ACTN|nr:hypothetical protein CDG81_21515 [Actinopolyspora erythraea]KGI82909.1 hypothetical protein IL38_03360 [Actinopolyspora erythraea]
MKDALRHLDRPLDAHENAFTELIRSGKAEREHYARLIRYIDVSLDAQVAGYTTGVARFPHRPVATPYMEFAEIKLGARRLMRSASAALGEDPAPSGAEVLPLSAHSMPWYFLWLGAVGTRAQSGLGLYASMLAWHHVCASVVDALSGTRTPPPEEFTLIFRRFESPPTELLDQCAEAAEHGLELGDDLGEALMAARLGETVILDFMSAATGNRAYHRETADA